MSKQFSIAVAIWARTIFINGFVTPIIMFFTLSGASILSGIILIIVQLIITSPLIAFITPVVKASVRLPYTALACKAWLAFILMLMAFLFIMAFGWALNLNFRLESWGLLTGTLLSVFLAVMSVRKSIDNFKIENDANNLV